MINVLYQFNEKYAPYAGISIVSLLENNKEEDNITIWILGENLSDESIDKLSNTVKDYSSDSVARNAVFVDSTSVIDKMKELNMPMYRGSYAANIRLFVSMFIPEEIERLIYLDSDTIVAGKLQDLISLDMGENVIAMAYDSLGESKKSELGLNADEGYYNSGVILFDLPKWREQSVTEAIIDHVKNVRAQYSSPDQDLLNIVCRGKIYTLSPSMNYQPIHDAYSDAIYYKYYGKTKYYLRNEVDNSRHNVCIYHCFRFLGEFPWHKGNIHPFNAIFDKYLLVGRWHDYQKKSADLGAVFKIEKIMYRILPSSIFLFIFYLIRIVFYKRAGNMSKNNKISKSI